VGAISSQKNYDLLIETAADLSRRIPQVMFEVAGGGDALPDFRARVEAEGLTQIVRFLGERSDVRELLSEADIFLNTSLYEGQSVAILEAMAMALPVVATDVPGNRDLVVAGRNGVRAPLGDPRALSQALQRLIEEPEFYAEVSANARKAGLEFSATRSSDAHLDLYRQLCAKE
jgi:glycosyltransferase involved in cell wall biosynthesis